MTITRALTTNTLSWRGTATDWLLRVLTAAGLATDAAIHWYRAPTYDPAPGFSAPGMLSEGDLFRAETVIAALAAVLVLLGTRLTWAVAFVVAASAFGAVVLYGSVDVGTLGPLPDMYDPQWSSYEVWCAVAEGVAVVTSLIGFALAVRSRSVRARLTPATSD